MKSMYSINNKRNVDNNKKKKIIHYNNVIT